MIKRNNKKGFTIVELVIVIAVIAILAAVLIPTFAGIIKKAQLSSDQQAVRNMNVALAASGDLNDDMNAVIDALSENGFNSKKALVPVSKDYKFMYSKANDCIVLVNEKNEVVYPEDITYDEADLESLENSVKYLNAEVKDVAGLAEAIANGQMEIKLEENLDVKTPFAVAANTEITVDLNGKTLTTDWVDSQKHSYAFNVEGTLTLENGTVDARGIHVYDGGKVVIGEGATVNAVDDDGGACLWIYEGGEVVINGGTFNAVNGLSDANYDNGEPGVVYNKGTLTIKGGTFTAKSDVYTIVNEGSGTLTIEGGTFIGNRGVVCANGGTVTISGGTFEVTGEHPNPAHVVYALNAKVTVTGGEFENKGSGEEFCVDSKGSGSITDNRNK